MSKRWTLTLATMIVFCLAAVSWLAPAAQAGESNIEGDAPPKVNYAPVKSSPYGQTYSEWIRNNAEWIFGIPAAENPLFGGDILVEQTHCPVVMLPGSPGGPDPVPFAVTVPPKTAFHLPMFVGTVFTPLDPVFTEAVGDFYGIDVSELTLEERVQLEARFFNDPGNFETMTVVLNGETVPNPLGFLAMSEPFNLADYDFLTDVGVIMEPDNVTVVGGYAMILHPLPPGTHTFYVDVLFDPPPIGDGLIDIPPAQYISEFTVTVAPGAPDPCATP